MFSTRLVANLKPLFFGHKANYFSPVQQQQLTLGCTSLVCLSDFAVAVFQYVHSLPQPEKPFPHSARVQTTHNHKQGVNAAEWRSSRARRDSGASNQTEKKRPKLAYSTLLVYFLTISLCVIIVPFGQGTRESAETCLGFSCLSQFWSVLFKCPLMCSL